MAAAADRPDRGDPHRVRRREPAADPAPDELATPAAADPGAAPASNPPLIISPLPGPPAPDVTAQVEEGRRRHEAELAAAERLVAQARAGAPVPSAARPAVPPASPAPGHFRIVIDWRGETADCLEHDRRVRLECFYWGGRAGRVSLRDATWEHDDGRRAPLTPDERALVLRRVVEHAREFHHIALRTDGA